jgi:hypothetical protein
MSFKKILSYIPIPIPSFYLCTKNTIEPGWVLFNIGLILVRIKVGRHPVASIGWGWSESTPIRPWPTLTDVSTGCSDYALCVAWLGFYYAWGLATTEGLAELDEKKEE